MSIGPYLKSRPWSTWFGYLLFVGMLATGYYYNLTFIQLGLYDLGTRRVGMSKPEVAQMMAFTILLIPVSLIGLAFFGLAVVYGWIALASTLGQWLSHKFKWRVNHKLAAAIGTFFIHAGGEPSYTNPYGWRDHRRPGDAAWLRGSLSHSPGLASLCPSSAERASRRLAIILQQDLTGSGCFYPGFRVEY